MNRRLTIGFLTLAATLAWSAGARAQSPQDQLWDAAISGDVAAVNTALDAGADIHALDTRTNRNGRKALNWAAWYNHVAVIDVLLERGANINAVNNTGFAPLHHAAENGSLEAAIALMAAGANRQQKTFDGATPLDVALFKGHGLMAELLKIATEE